MARFNKVHERRVEKLARVVESKRGGAYNQAYMHHNCGTPACLWGWALDTFPRARLANYFTEQVRMYLLGDPPDYRTVAGEVWSRDLFGISGCDNAGRSGKKAAAFLRQTAADLKAALKEGI